MCTADHAICTLIVAMRVVVKGETEGSGGLVLIWLLPGRLPNVLCLLSFVLLILVASTSPLKQGSVSVVLLFSCDVLLDIPQYCGWICGGIAGCAGCRTDVLTRKFAAGPFKMSVANKILRTANAPSTAPDKTETEVAQALIDLENNVPELKAELRPLQISAAREVDVRGGKKAIVVFVPVPQLKAFRKVQQRCVIRRWSMVAPFIDLWRSGSLASWRRNSPTATSSLSRSAGCCANPLVLPASSRSGLVRAR